MFVPMRPYSLIACCVCWLATAFSPAASQHYAKVYSQAQLQEDVQFLLRQLEAAHLKGQSGLMTQAFLQECDHLLHDLAQREGLKGLEFYRRIRRLLALTEQRHLRVGLGSTDHGLLRPATSRRAGIERVFPFQLRFLADGNAYIWENYSDDLTIKKGDEVLQINGYPVAELVEALSPYIAADGNVRLSKLEDLSRAFSMEYALFVEQPLTFTLTYLSRKQQTILETEVAAVSPEQWHERRATRYRPWDQSPGEEEVYTLSFDAPRKAAILHVKTFDLNTYHRHRLNFVRLFEEIFDKLSKNESRYLLLDVRNNPGGSLNCMVELLAYLLPESRERLPGGVIKQAVSLGGQEKVYRFPDPKPRAFRGQLLVLTNASTFSAASELAGYLKAYSEATLIGTETAGQYEGFAAGYLRQFRLPHTGIKVWLPRMQYTFELPPQVEPKRGVLPHHWVQPGVEDLLQGLDPQLDFALRLIHDE